MDAANATITFHDFGILHEWIAAENELLETAKQWQLSSCTRCSTFLREQVIFRDEAIYRSTS